MADSILSIFVNKLGPLIVEEAKFFRGVEKDLIYLYEELEWIKSFLRAAESERLSSQLVDVCVKQIIDTAYDAEDVIDSYMLYVERQRRRNLFMKMIHYFHERMLLQRLRGHIQEINARVQRISSRRSSYNLNVSAATLEVGSRTAEEMGWRRSGASLQKDFEMVGREDERKTLACWLSDKLSPQLKIISITGMGGVGKTALARATYSREDVANHFPARAWLAVSQIFEAKDFIVSALKELIINGSGMTSNEVKELPGMDYTALEAKLRGKLKEKRYLVVIDDIWKAEVWERICGVFPDGEVGSRIMLTTRHVEVVNRVDSGCHLAMRMLTKKESWELFQRKVFSAETCPPQLEEKGKLIVKKCRGLPLAILGMAGIVMGKERTVGAWSKVLDSANWIFSQYSSLFREVLSLSYYDLPEHLKPCFLYLGLFPEDSDIEAEHLICRWVAEGFIQARGATNMEDVAEEYLEELIQRNMVLVKNRAYQGGRVLNCSVDNLQRHLAISKATTDRFMDIHANSSSSVFISNKLRRLAIHSDTGSEDAKQIAVTTPKLRSLLVFQKHFEAGMYLKSSTFENAVRMLRVLDLGEVQTVEVLPVEIGKLTLLRYLALGDTILRRFPRCMSKLVNLQTLSLAIEFQNQREATSFLKTIQKLTSLRHLHLHPNHIADLEDTQHVCPSDFGRNLLSLTVEGYMWRSMSDVLVNAQCLQKLFLWNTLKTIDRLPESLTVLHLRNPGLRDDPSPTLGSLPKLKELILEDPRYTREKLVFPASAFCQLEYLQLFKMGITEWRLEDGALPNLKHLNISQCPSLVKLPPKLQDVKSLQEIILVGNDKAFEERSIEHEKDWDIIKDVPFKYIPMLASRSVEGNDYAPTLFGANSLRSGSLFDTYSLRRR